MKGRKEVCIKRGVRRGMKEGREKVLEEKEQMIREGGREVGKLDEI